MTTDDLDERAGTSPVADDDDRDDDESPRRGGRPRDTTTRTTASGKKRRGVCSECGAPAHSRTATLCDDHAALRADRAPRAPRAATGSTSAAHAIAAQLRTNLELAAQLWGIRDPECATVLMRQAPAIADYWGTRAAESIRVQQALEMIVGSGGWLGALAVHAPVALAVFAHHVAPALERRRAALAGDDADAAPDPRQYETFPPAAPSSSPADGIGIVNFADIPPRTGDASTPPHVDYRAGS